MKTLLILAAIFAITANSMAQWVRMATLFSQNVYVLASNGGVVFSGVEDNGVRRSVNNCSTWAQIMPPYGSVKSLLIHGNDIYAGTSNYIYKSTNNGLNFDGSGNIGFNSMAANVNTIFGGSLNGVWKSTNNGANWSITSLTYSAQSLAARNNDIIAGTGTLGIFRSTDNGSNWSQVIQYLNVRALILAGNNEDFYAGTNAGFWKSTNYGANWFQTSLGNYNNVASLAVSGASVFAGLYGDGVYVSNDGGANWTQRNEGLGNLTIRSLCVCNGFLIAGTTAGIWIRPLGQITGVQPVTSEIPEEFSLSQNYPNPFNPSTTIRFSIPVRSNVKLVVFSLSGQQVVNLVDGELNAGKYEHMFDGAKLSSGVYFYKLTTGGFTISKKMMLVK
jgi:hypothetical protein